MIDVTTPPAPQRNRPIFGTRRTYRPNARHIPVLATLALLVVMYSVGVYNYDGFSDTQVILNVFVDNAFLLVVAVGMTYVILTGGIDLSVGAVIALTTTVAATLLEAGWPAGVVLPLALLIGTVMGLGMGCVIHFFKVEPFIATLAGMFLARGLSLLINRNSIPITNEFWTQMAQKRFRFDDGVFISLNVVIAVVVVVIAAIVLAWTRFGRNIYAVGGNADSALLMGLPVGRTRIAVYTFSGFCASLGGVLYSFYTSSGYSLHGQGLELDAIAAVVIGGVLLTGGSGYVLGTVLGVLVLGLIQTIITFQGDLNSWWTRIVVGILLFAFIVLQRLVTRKAK
ncbi:galactofuranose ABC transporter, permease protein YjfF [Paractinoplanes brasiliensis]|uniref:Simple sugar transport system permease protein n=1 Tax=Paractinoplanes brasiliensis TaxID=52695 RepID=A0A4R6JCY7_9ACTN|nr:galactofuranose ABC transporter, permease protein YjfF [Actinoplanes brasiliensis]TDO32405.1 simple sugar transport system permease protein [Actinoplanes brasiliensis]GID27727.1 sugar ABC transporter permease [Actinoplanes brasiliensis]